MKTELVAKWVVVGGHLELQWSTKKDDWVKRLERYVFQLSKAA